MLYKVISKVLAHRLKTILPEAIEANQSAFIKDRLLLENVILASELVNGYHKYTISSKSTIKFDISKAFDTVKLSFIVLVLQAMGLPQQFIHWIRVCISTASFSVSVNGELERFFTSEAYVKLLSLAISLCDTKTVIFLSTYQNRIYLTFIEKKQ